MKKFFETFLPTELVEDYTEVANQMTRKDVVKGIIVVTLIMGVLALAGYIDNLPY